MNSPHPDIGPELRRLAQTVLDRLDPAVRAAAATVGDAQREPGACQQVWCPVCALAALVNGEQHPLLNLIAEHSITLMTMVRTMAASAPDGSTPPPAADGESPPVDSPPPAQSPRYQDIPIVVEPIVEQVAGDPTEASQPPVY